MKKKDLVSIIIRTKNEERWISYCLKSIQKQTYNNYEIIIVDNLSTDKTLEKIKKFNVKKIINITNFLPGKSLNEGIKISKGKYVVCLSAHCIPTNKFWLNKLVKTIEEFPKAAAVYGKQEPMNFTDDNDKRDMNIIFGLDRKIQVKDNFFHNANSIIKKKLLINYPFDNNITNIEDRIWAKKILTKGYNIIYEPKASVYHYHGIHQAGERKRLKNVIKIFTENNLTKKTGSINPSDLNIIAILPIRGTSQKINNKILADYTIQYLKKSKYIKKIFLSSDNKSNLKIAKKNDIDFILRLKKLSKSNISLENVQQYSLKKIEELNIYPDLVVHVEETFPLRPKSLIDRMIIRMLENGYDSIIASKLEPGWLWREDINGEMKRIDSGDQPRQIKEKSYIGLKGVGCITYPNFIRDGSLIGGNIGLYEVLEPLVDLEIRDKKYLNLVKNLFNKI